MSFRVSSPGRAVDVSNTVICYIPMINGGIVWFEKFGLLTASEFVVMHRDDCLGDSFTNLFMERRFESVPALVSACVCELGKLCDGLVLDVR